MIAIIDYGLGNVRAFANIYKRLNIPHAVVSRADELQRADGIILPGVGAFDHAMERLEQSGMRRALDEQVRNRRVPVLGVCIGMHMLGRSSEEGRLPGLGWIEGEVKKFDPTAVTAKINLPHMGWNDVRPAGRSALFEGLEENAVFYFLHSYYFSCDHDGDVIALTEYGRPFASAVNSGNVCGVQFHPEKSHRHGIRLLANFAALAGHH